MNDLIELSDAEFTLVAGGCHPSQPAKQTGSATQGGQGTSPSQGITAVIIEIALALNINSPGAVAIAGNNASSWQGIL
jgi:hypothetical protein